MNSGKEFGSFQSAPPPTAIVPEVEVEGEEKVELADHRKKQVEWRALEEPGADDDHRKVLVVILVVAPGGARRARSRARCRPKRGRLELELNTSPATKLKC